MRRKNEQGFTLVEVIVVAAIIAILAGILVPMIFSQIDDSKITRAKGDIKSLTSAIYAFRKDVGLWPKNIVDGACNSTLLISDGPGLTAGMAAALQGLLYNVNGVKPFSSQLTTDPGNGCYSNWRGPYIPGVELDPWGNPYILRTLNIEISGEPALILSAGADGVFNTPGDADTVDPNDVGIRLK